MEAGDEFEEVADVVRGGASPDPALRPVLDALQARLGHPVVALTTGSMNSVAGPGLPGVELPTMTAWVRGAVLERRRAESDLDAVIAEHGPWRWRHFARRTGAVTGSRARRIAALGELVTQPIVATLASFDEEATIRALESIPRARWEQVGDDRVWTVAVNAELRRIAVFLHTGAQVEELLLTHTWHAWQAQLRAVVAEHDEFGSADVIPVEIELDSREGFDAEYAGNWSYYWY